MAGAKNGRANQLRRTRKNLLEAAARLAAQGRRPSLEDVAAEALVSRATAYRHFPDVAALLAEAALEIAAPRAETLFAGADAEDAVARLERVDAALYEMAQANEGAMRMMLAHSLQRRAAAPDTAELPTRQNRRTPLIEAALEPARAQFKPAALKHLGRALALIIGTEAMVVCKDVLQIDAAEAQRVRRWAIRALVEAARKPQGR